VPTNIVYIFAKYRPSLIFFIAHSVENLQIVIMKYPTTERKRQFILHNHEYIITKQLLDNVRW